MIKRRLVTIAPDPVQPILFAQSVYEQKEE